MVELLGGSLAQKIKSLVGRSVHSLFSAIVSLKYEADGLADRKGHKVMLLWSTLGMAIVMILMGLVQNIWQFLILHALLGLLDGFVPTKVACP